MERLIHDMGENSAAGYDAIYQARKEKGVDVHDVKRWKKLLKFYRGGRLIDLGCLDSLVPVIAKKWYPQEEVWGLDEAGEAINEMRRTYPFVDWIQGDVYATKFPPNYFSYIVAGELIEHLDRPEDFIAEAFRILKTGGVLALSTPEDEAREPGAVDDHRHIWSFKPEDIQTMLEPYGQTWLRSMGSDFFPQYEYHWPSILGYCRKK